MIVLDVEQGTTEWAQARLGIPTASQFHRILTPKTMKLSSQADGYMCQLLAEQLLGEAQDDATSGLMLRGTLLEQRAVSYYELQTECDTVPVGFVMRDDKRVGASPDRFVGKDGLLEIKVPSAKNHLEYMLDDEGVGYRAQVQGQLWIAEREWCDTLSYNPELPPALVRQNRDEKFIKALAETVDQFLNYMDESKRRLQKRYGLFAGFEVPQLKVVA